MRRLLLPLWSLSFLFALFLSNSLIFTGSISAQEGSEKPNPKSLKFSKWTPDFQVPDPVAISFDGKGRAYVTQTQRRKANDLDIRQNRDWIPNDLSFESADDKRAFYREKFTPENSDANKKRVKDFNNDGKHDIKDLQALTERIYLIEDTDDDGKADKKSVYVENFQDEIAGIAAGVLHHEGAVYTTIVPDVWKLRDTNDDGKADERESIAYGFGTHLAYAGHDMHGLTVGPDGRIYWTVGDKGMNVTSKEGIEYKFPNHGALMRCEPDGSGFEVYAHGLRNVQEIAFDQYGNIFGVDNDSDRPGEKERFIYIVQHMDAGWRSNWQYRGSNQFNPWMDENLSVPFQKGQPNYITPPIRLYNNGPAGMAFNPGTALGPEWENYFFHTSAPNGQQWAFQVEEDGASYKMVNDMQIGNGVPIVGINFSPDGALYGVDWGGGYPLNEKGAVWKWDVEGAADSDRRKQTAKLLAGDFTKTSVENLGFALFNPDQRVRMKAQFELVSRGDRVRLNEAALTKSVGALAAFQAIADSEKVKSVVKITGETPSNQLGRFHAIWGIGQLNRKAEKPEFDTLISLLKDSDAEIRAQAAKTIGDSFGGQLARHQVDFTTQQGRVDDSTGLSRGLIPLLADESDRVKFQAAISLGNIGDPSAVDPLIAMMDKLGDSTTPYLRHAAVIGLTGCAPSETLAGLRDEESELKQTAAIIALRRRADPAAAKYLDSPKQTVAEDAARAIHDDWMIQEAMPTLAESLATTKLVKSESFVRRAINANFRLGGAAEADRVAAFVSQAEVPEKLRMVGLDALSQWTEPPVLDRVVGRYRPLEKRDPKIASEAVAKFLGDWLTDESGTIQTEAMSLARSLKIDLDVKTLVAVAGNDDSLPGLRIEAMRGLQSQNSPDLSDILTAALGSTEPAIRDEALKLLAESDAEKALQIIPGVIENKNATNDEKQTALNLLGAELASEAGDAVLQSLVAKFDTVPAAIQLDLAEAATDRKISGAPEPDVAHTLEGGNAKRGEDIFMNHIAAQCIRCHKVKDGKGSDIGPNLKSIGKTKDRAYLLESLIDPQKVITDGYGSISLTLKNGDSVAGQFRKEKGGVIEIRDPENKITKVKSADVKERSDVVSTMPPMGLILKKRGIRDVIAYLSTLNAPVKK